VSELSPQQIVILLPGEAKLKGSLTVRRKTSRGFHWKKFNLKKLNDVEGKEQ
jgi:hypothetical protein